jgi:hypothetical protein
VGKLLLEPRQAVVELPLEAGEAQLAVEQQKQVHKTAVEPFGSIVDTG